MSKTIPVESILLKIILIFPFLNLKIPREPFSGFTSYLFTFKVFISLRILSNINRSFLLSFSRNFCILSINLLYRFCDNFRIDAFFEL